MADYIDSSFRSRRYTRHSRARAYIQITPRNVRENTAASLVGITGRSRPLSRRRRRRRGHRRGPHLVGRRRGQPRRPRPQGPHVPDLFPATVGRGVVAGPAAVVVTKRRVAGGGPDAPPTHTGGADRGGERTHEENDEQEPSEDCASHGARLLVLAQKSEMDS